jgi:hypothetical protein
MSYVVSLAITLFVEVPVYMAFLVALLRVRARPAARCAIVVNLVSHPLGFLVIDPLLRMFMGALPALLIVEAWAWGVETLLVWVWLRRSLPTIAAIAFVANAASFAVGTLALLLNYY